MLHRDLGRAGLRVSELGHGTWGMGGWKGGSDEESLAALRRSIELGVNFVDTAYVYGDGHSERLIGRVLRETSADVYVATKIPPRNRQWPARPGTPAEEAFPADWIVETTERSLEYLGVDTIDVQQFHVWSDEWVGSGDWLEGIERLKRDGKIRCFGVSINDNEPENALRLVESGHVDTVQVIYNVFEQAPEERLFPLCQEHGVGVIVRVPFDEGSLAGTVRPDTEFESDDFRAGYFAGHRKREVWERVQALADDLGVSVEEVPELALRFCLSHPAVSTVIPGMRSVRNVERNAAAAAKGPLPQEQLERLRAHRWDRNFYNAA
jgi:aryl-alcohol dehydrogenase-like predicted oxidoreductase